MLDLASATSDAWVQRACDALPVILLDHAHCEKKAASMAINLIFRYQWHPGMMLPMAALAREELEHFELVIGQIRDRGGEFGPMAPSAYAGRLLAATRKEEPHRLLDTLLACALIEARSCERMKRLSRGLEARNEPALAGFYESLLASEARHFHGYVELAMDHFGREVARARLHALAEAEAVCNDQPEAEIRFHGGVPA